jgi:hypothetical protein
MIMCGFSLLVSVQTLPRYFVCKNGTEIKKRSNCRFVAGCIIAGEYLHILAYEQGWYAFMWEHLLPSYGSWYSSKMVGATRGCLF